MALPAELDFKIKFDQTNDPANFQLEDTTPYSTLAIELEDVRGIFAPVIDPLGNVIHNNTDFSAPDITASLSLLYTGLNIPTDADGDIVSGQYSFTYNIKVDNPIIDIDQGLGRIVIDGEWAHLIPDGSSIVIVRSTGNNGTYTVDSAANALGVTTIFVVEALPSATVDGSIQYEMQEVYAVTKTVTYSDLIPAVKIEVQTDCFCGVLKSIDKTNYGTATIVDRTHTVKYPAALSIADIVSSSATITVSPIYTKTWTTIIESNIDIDLGNGNTISAFITGSKETNVECDLTLCDISCCVLALNNRYLDARCENPPLADKYFKDLTRMMQLIDMFQMFNSCSQHDEANEALAEIKKVGNCSDSCGCTDDEPAIVIPLCTSGGSSNIKVIAGSGINVTASLVNGNYTYQVNLASSILSIINSVRPQNVLAGLGINVTYSNVGGVDTWTIANTATYTAPDRLDFLCRIQYTSSTSATITNSAYSFSGENIVGTATVASTTIATAGASANFRVSGFQVAPNNNYKVTTELVIASNGGGYNSNSFRPITLEVLNKSSGQFDFRFIKDDSFPSTNAGMVEINDLYVNIKISE